jgi:hypothetical protein
MLDVMPTEESVLGFGNRWYKLAVRTAHPVALPSGQSIRLITAPVFLATKIDAFRGRGAGDFLASHDLEDVIVLIDGRPELMHEVRGSDPELRTYIAGQMSSLLGNPLFLESLPGHLPGDEASQARLPLIRNRLRTLTTND